MQHLQQASLIDLGREPEPRDGAGETAKECCWPLGTVLERLLRGAAGHCRGGDVEGGTPVQF